MPPQSLCTLKKWDVRPLSDLKQAPNLSGRRRLADRGFRWLVVAAGLIVLVVLLGSLRSAVIVTLVPPTVLPVAGDSEVTVGVTVV